MKGNKNNKIIGNNKIIKNMNIQNSIYYTPVYSSSIPIYIYVPLCMQILIYQVFWYIQRYISIY